MESPLLRLLISSWSINKHGRHRQFKFDRGPSIDASYPVSYYLVKRFQRKSCFRNRPIRNKNCLWQICFITDQNGMSNSHKGPCSVLSFLKAEWKVSDTGSAQCWASSLLTCYIWWVGNIIFLYEIRCFIMAILTYFHWI
jgi:hypothetical protein